MSHDASAFAPLPTLMRAAAAVAYGDADVIKVMQVPTPGVDANGQPALKPHDVLVRVVASSVNPVDWKTRLGHLKLVHRPRMPLVLGRDAAGVVVAAGTRSRFRPGDRVFGMNSYRQQGTNADYALFEDAHLVPIPSRLTFAQAASLPLVYLTAYQALVHTGNVQEGQRVLVIGGAGGVGSVAVQLAAAMRAHVTATCSTRNIEYVRGLGANEVIDYTTTRFDDAQPGSFDLVLDTVGGKDITEAAYRAASPTGRIVSIIGDFGSNLTVTSAFTAGATLLWRKASALVTKRPKYSLVFVKVNQNDLRELVHWIDDGLLAPQVGHEFTLEQLADAHRLSESAHARGKIVIVHDAALAHTRPSRDGATTNNPFETSSAAAAATSGVRAGASGAYGASSSSSSTSEAMPPVATFVVPATSTATASTGAEHGAHITRTAALSDA